MLTVLDRYVSREVMGQFSGVVLVLFLIFISNRLVRYLADAAAGGIPPDLIFTLLGLKAIKYLVLLMPFSLYLSILLAQGRLSRDSEMVALQAAGMSTARLYRPLFSIAVPLSLLVGLLTFQLAPWTSQVEYRLLHEAEQNIDFTGITPGRFRESNDGRRVIYVQNMSPDLSDLQNVIIQASDQQRQLFLSAKSGRIERDAAGNRVLVLLDGYRYELALSKVTWRVTQYQEHRLTLQQAPKGGQGAYHRDAYNSAELWQSSHPADQAELQWRLAMPLSALVLTLLALPLGRSKPRQGRFGKLVLATVVYALYVNLLTVAQSWMIKGKLAPEVGLWWVHVLFVLLAVALLVHQHGMPWAMQVFRGKGRTL